jgi:hypothetical protein
MSECCSKEKCPCSCHTNHSECENQDDFISWFFEIADEAWEEVLKEEIKKHIRETQEDRMKELAKIVSESNSHRWKSKMEKKRCSEECEDKIRGFFCQKSS